MTEYIPKRGRGDRERQTSQGEFQRIAIDPLPRGGGAPNTPPLFFPPKHSVEKEKEDFIGRNGTDKTWAK